jgi:hypothetical protein
MNTVIKIPVSAISGSGSATLSNVGAGYRLVKTADGQVKTTFAGYGIIKDSTTNTDGITDRVDTSSTNHVVTQSDLNDGLATKQATGNYITALTSDITASGPGSAAATIATNVVSNTKFRQSAPNSVVGRSVNSTGNVADIAAATNSTYLTFDGSILKFDSIDYAHLKNTPDLQNPGVYFSPAESLDPSFIVFASAIPRVTSTFAHGSPIIYEILAHSSNHNSSFYDSIYGDAGTERLAVRFPPVKNVLNSKLNVDELLASQGIFVGASVATNGLSAPVYQSRSIGIRLTGDGAGNWTPSALFSTGSFLTISTYNTVDGGTSFDWAGINYDPDQISIQYIGTNNYHIRRTYSSLGIYTGRFQLLDEFGNAVTTNPTTSDEVVITNAGMQSRQIPMATYINGANAFMTGFANFWIDGAFECWLVAAPTSSSSITVRWQTTYPSATNYKIYRATSLYGSRTLIHTGTSGSYVDSGLSSGTLYWYFMIAVIGGVDTEITYFRTSTKS